MSLVADICIQATGVIAWLGATSLDADKSTLELGITADYETAAVTAFKFVESRYITTKLHGTCTWTPLPD